MPVWYNEAMSLFSHYQSSGKPFPCGSDGFLEPNFKREWLLALGRNRYHLDDEQNIRTWQREWPTLDDDSKKAAMGNLITMVGRRKVDTSNDAPANPVAVFKQIEPYLSVYSDKDTLAWVTAFMSSDLAERSSQDHEVPTVTFAAHLLDWTRSNRPSALTSCVAMLESWVPLSHSKIYKEDEDWPGALERLSRVMPNTALERTSAIACAISGKDELLTRLLSRPNTNTLALCKQAQTMTEPGTLFNMLAALKTKDKNTVFLGNAKSLGKHMLALHKKQEKLATKEGGKRLLSGAELRYRSDFFQKLVELDVPCGDSSVSFLKKHAGNISIARFFHLLGEVSRGWDTPQHHDFMNHWVSHGGIFLGEDMFGTAENTKAVIGALVKLPEVWTEWFESEYSDRLKKAGAHFFASTSTGSAIEAHRWFHDHMPKVYQHWIRGMPADIALLTDPVVGETAWNYTRAGSPHFLFDATLDWVKAPEMNYDMRHAGYPMAQLAWKRHDVDLEASLVEAMKDKESDYRSLALEAISPGKGKHRWQALMCIIDAFKDNADPRAHWTDQPLVQDVIRTCIQERLDPALAPDLHIDNAPSLFSSMG